MVHLLFFYLKLRFYNLLLSKVDRERNKIELWFCQAYRMNFINSAKIATPIICMQKRGLVK